MAKTRGLGRGLDALLGDQSDEEPSDRLLDIAIDDLQPGKYQPRTRMDAASLAELADSIKARGLIQPILARPLVAGKYEIIAGERRWRAARLAGLTSIAVLVRDVPDQSALALALIENIQRENLNPLEEAAGLKRLIGEFGLTHEDAARSVARSRSAVTNLLRLLSLAPPVQQMLMDEQLDMGHARALLALSHVKQREIAALIAERGLSVRETERLVQRLGTQSRSRRAPDPDTARLQEGLSESLGAAVTISHSARQGRGRLVIAYHSLEQLDSIVARLNPPQHRGLTANEERG